MNIIGNEGRVDRVAREAEKARLMYNLREILNNKPVLPSDVINAIKPILSYRHAALPELIMMVNQSLYPLKVEFNGIAADRSYNLRVVDTRETNDWASTHDASLISDQLCSLYLQGRILNLRVGKENIRLKSYNSKEADTYKACEALIRKSPQYLTRADLGITGKSSLKDLLSNMGFTGRLREKFVDHDRSSISIRKKAQLTRADVEEIKAASNKK